MSKFIQRGKVMRVTRSVLSALVVASVSVFSSGAQAAWELNSDESQLTYITSKAAAISELNSFDGLSGEISDVGQASLVIDLTTVNTAIEIRDQRMRDIVFKVQDNATAAVVMNVSEFDLPALSAGDQLSVNIQAGLTIQGVSEIIDAQVSITKLADASVQVITTSPILINASLFGLHDSVEELREIAGLPSINPNVVVNFSLLFEQQ